MRLFARRKMVVALELSKSAGTPACRWRPAAPLHGTTRRATSWKCMAPRRCRTGIATRLALMLGRQPDKVQLYEGHVGGGFGIRGEMYPEDVLVCAAALKFKRPIKWIEDRREHLIAANHSRQQRHRIRAAIDAERPHSRHRGRILSRQWRLHAHARGDRPRSCRRHAARPLSHAGLSRSGHIRLTNKTPAAPTARPAAMNRHSCASA